MLVLHCTKHRVGKRGEVRDEYSLIEVTRNSLGVYQEVRLIAEFKHYVEYSFGEVPLHMLGLQPIETDSDEFYQRTRHKNL